MAQAIVKSVNGLLGDPGRACEVLGAIQNPRTVQRIKEAAAEGGEVLRASETLSHERFPEARVRSPLILKVRAGETSLFMREMFGPIIYLVETKDSVESIDLAAKAAREQGAITCAIYSTDSAVLQRAEEATALAGVALSCNLIGQIFVNQSAAFSDFHVSGANPAGNASLCDGAFVANRFRIAQRRSLVSPS